MTDAPLSRPVLVSSVPSTGLAVDVVADAVERESLAAENEVESIERLVARFEVMPFGRDGLAVKGHIEAEATRICGVSLEPFVEPVREEIDLRFTPDAGGASGARESDDPPDPLVGGAVDLGAVTAEFFTLGLSPYPKKPGAELDAGGVRDEAASPFAALRGLSGGPGERD
jgi:uncharacterized metal-binding protein YceD (DUF177 family)